MRRVYMILFLLVTGNVHLTTLFVLFLWLFILCHLRFSYISSHSSMLSVGGGSDTEVTWEDQQNINKFGRLNNRFHELEDEIKIAKETNDNLEDAGNELILTDEEVVRFQIGEVFAHVPKDEVESRIEQMKEVTSQKLEKLEEEKESVLAQMSELKKILYAKFNDSINLEED
ncbi:hypothetical protein RJT34_22837 [Clitoria ternatea]|uniref:Prefoldin subunit 4 n=1 Tax=Clitoria ternatea TaxID=43366 RepID=A0AAN9FKN4_CLITE